MYILILLVIVLALAVIAVNTIRLIVRTLSEWAAYGVLFVFLASFVSLGVYFGFDYEYMPSNTLRVSGFPLPVVVFQFEDGCWIDYVSPVAIFIAALNVVLIVLSGLAVLNPLFRICLKLGKLFRKPSADNCAS